MATIDERGASEYINHSPTYHNDKESPYVLPNDPPEHVRLETQARHLSAIMNDRIIHAPVDKTNVKRILDVGCGTGIVTDYLGREFSDADVVGLDLSSVPKLRDRPPNVRFLQGNILTDKPSSWLPDHNVATSGSEALPGDAAAFDLIYSRLLLCGMSEWPKYINTDFSLLRPGGWAEVHDLDWIWYGKAGQIISDAWPWWRRLRSAGEGKGLDFSCGSKTQAWMKHSNFEDVQVTQYRWPFGGQWEKDEVWKEFGEYGWSAMVEMLWHLIPRLMEGQPDVTPDAIEEMRREMKQDFAPEEGKHWVFYVTYGRKPL